MQEHVFNDAYRKYASGIFRFIYFKVSDFETAKDLTADTFTRFWKVLQNEKIVENSRAFLYVIAKGLIVDHYRKKGSHRTVRLGEVDERLLEYTDKNEDSFLHKQELEQVLIKVKKLKKEYQDILLFYYVEELDVKEISFILNKKENNVRVLLHRALTTLKKSYER